MHEINNTPPSLMTAQQRRDEVALLLAMGLVRLRDASNRKSACHSDERAVLLDFTASMSVHSDPANYKYMKCK